MSELFTAWKSWPLTSSILSSSTTRSQRGPSRRYGFRNGLSWRRNAISRQESGYIEAVGLPTARADDQDYASSRHFYFSICRPLFKTEFRIFRSSLLLAIPNLFASNSMTLVEPQSIVILSILTTDSHPGNRLAVLYSCKAQIPLGSSRNVSTRHDTFDVSSQSS